MRRTANVQMGLILGIAASGVILALSGCAATVTTSASPAAPEAQPEAQEASDTGPALADFSDSERERILAVQDIVAAAAETHALEPSLINAVIWVESRFDPHAKSPAGARGLMQLMPATAAYLAKRMGEHNARAYDPEFNVNAGALYLAQMLDTFGDERLAVAAYHAGPGNVKRWVDAKQEFPDYSEAYVAKVMDAQARFAGVELHGRSSASRGHEGGAGIGAKSNAELEEELELEVPDVDSLPDAADIHGVPRVIYERPEPPTPPAAKPEPVAEPKPEYKPVESYEPVFIVHPELDAQPDAPPPGWAGPSAAPDEPSTRPKPSVEPEPEPEPKPKPKPKPKTGLGVLPDL